MTQEQHPNDIDALLTQHHVRKTIQGKLTSIKFVSTTTPLVIWTF